VPSLSCFATTPSLVKDLGLINLSGVTYNADEGTVVVVTNKPQVAYEYTLAGEKLQEWQLSDWSDSEGITWIEGRRFVITEENPSAIFEVELSKTQNTASKGRQIGNSVEAKNNKGFEGVAFLPGYGFLAAREKFDPDVFHVAVKDLTEVPEAHFQKLTGGKVTDLRSRNIGDFAGLSASGDSVDEVFVVSEEMKAVYRLRLTDLQVVEEFSETSRMVQPEGITFAFSDGMWKMIVVGEKDRSGEIYVWEARGCGSSTSTATPTAKPPVTTTTTTASSTAASTAKPKVTTTTSTTDDDESSSSDDDDDSDDSRRL